VDSDQHLVPLLPVINPIVFLTEMALAIAFILGCLVRPLGAIGMLFVAHSLAGTLSQPGGVAMALYLPHFRAGVLRSGQRRNEPWASMRSLRARTNRFAR
jgi:hypothetical protein